MAQRTSNARQGQTLSGIRGWLHMWGRRRLIWARCLACDETYRTHPDDLIHDERVDGTFCGGESRPVARWEWRA